VKISTFAEKINKIKDYKIMATNNVNVEDLIIESLKELSKGIGHECSSISSVNGSKLIFPQYYVGEHKNTERISEQEARFLFVKQLETTNNVYYYSVEAPTKKAYKFSDNGVKYDDYPIIDENGQSASIDVCLYEKNTNIFQRTHLIEFKSGNPGQEAYSKDFLKLLCDENGLTNYFIHIVDVEDLLKRNTLNSIKTKYSTAIDHVKKIDSTEQSTVTIFLYNIKKKQICQSGPINIKNNNINFKPVISLNN
jgi:hypothetical protein